MGLCTNYNSFCGCFLFSDFLFILTFRFSFLGFRFSGFLFIFGFSFRVGFFILTLALSITLSTNKFIRGNFYHISTFQSWTLHLMVAVAIPIFHTLFIVNFTEIKFSFFNRSRFFFPANITYFTHFFFILITRFFSTILAL